MRDSGSIVVQDQAIAQILTAAHGGAAPLLFERYRIAGQNKDAFVAALIMRLCVAEARHALGADKDGRQ